MKVKEFFAPNNFKLVLLIIFMLAFMIYPNVNIFDLGSSCSGEEGCVMRGSLQMGSGFPFTVHYSYVNDSGQASFFSELGAVSDLIVWYVAACIIFAIYNAAMKRKTKKRR